MRDAANRSFEELYRGHRGDVFRAALRELGNVHDAEDVTQATFVDAYRAVLRGSEPESPRAWLLAIAENVRRRRFRSMQRRPREEPTDRDVPVVAELPHEPARALVAALGELPVEQRRVFALRELAGRSYDEIAAETGATVAAVQMQLFRARRTLRERLEPPQVQRPGRTGLVVPVPGWLTTLVSRADVTLLTPRAAGAVGATVLAIAGTTVAVQEGEAGAPAAPGAEPRPEVVSSSSSPGLVPQLSLRRPAATAATSRTGAKEAAPAPGRRRPVPGRETTTPPAPAPEAPASPPAPAPATVAAAAPGPAPATPAPAGTNLVDTAVQGVVEPAATAVGAPLGQAEDVLELPPVPVVVGEDATPPAPLVPPPPAPLPPPAPVPPLPVPPLPEPPPPEPPLPLPPLP